MAAAAATAAGIRRRDLAAQRAALSAGMSAEDVAKATTETEARVVAGRAKLAALTSSATPLVKPEERQKAIATLDRFRKMWSTRKAATMDVSIGSAANCIQNALLICVTCYVHHASPVRLIKFQVIDAICDGIGKSRKAVMEDIGLETDEAAKVDIKNFVLPPQPMVRRKL